jgi:hypothetical protein
MISTCLRYIAVNVRLPGEQPAKVPPGQQLYVDALSGAEHRDVMRQIRRQQAGIPS